MKIDDLLADMEGMILFRSKHRRFLSITIGSTLRSKGRIRMDPFNVTSSPWSGF